MSTLPKFSNDGLFILGSHRAFAEPEGVGFHIRDRAHYDRASWTSSNAHGVVVRSTQNAPLTLANDTSSILLHSGGITLNTPVTELLGDVKCSQVVVREGVGFKDSNDVLRGSITVSADDFTLVGETNQAVRIVSGGDTFLSADPTANAVRVHKTLDLTNNDLLNCGDLGAGSVETGRLSTSKISIPGDAGAALRVGRETEGYAWQQVGSSIEGEASGDQSGHSVSLSSDGTVVAIGAIYNDGNGVSSGHVRVWTWLDGNWHQRGSDINGEAAGNLSGWSVSLSGDGKVVAIGAKQNTNGNGVWAGHVRVYAWVDTVWQKLGDDIDGDVKYDQSGYSVSLSRDGSVVAIGATNHNWSENYLFGQVRVFAWNNAGHWQKLGDDIDGEALGDQSGCSVSLSGDGTVVAIGAVYNDGNGETAGHVKVCQWNTVHWQQLGGDIDGEAPYDRSGWSVSLSGDGTVVAIGAVYNDGNGEDSGHVKVWRWNAVEWQQLGGDIDGGAAGDTLGYSVSLSGDGTVVASASMVGYTRVWRWVDGSSWQRVGGDLESTSSPGASAGLDYNRIVSVSLSGDGSVVAIGSPLGGPGTFSGHTKVYRAEIAYDPQASVKVEGNLTISGTCDVLSDLVVSGNATVSGDLQCSTLKLDEELDVPVVTSSLGGEIQLLANEAVVLVQRDSENNVELLRANRDRTTIKSGSVNVSAATITLDAPTTALTGQLTIGDKCEVLSDLVVQETLTCGTVQYTAVAGTVGQVLAMSSTPGATTFINLPTYLVETKSVTFFDGKTQVDITFERVGQTVTLVIPELTLSTSSGTVLSLEASDAFPAWALPGERLNQYMGEPAQATYTYPVVTKVNDTHDLGQVQLWPEIYNELDSGTTTITAPRIKIFRDIQKNSVSWPGSAVCGTVGVTVLVYRTP